MKTIVKGDRGGKFWNVTVAFTSFGAGVRQFKTFFEGPWKRGLDAMRVLACAQGGFTTEIQLVRFEPATIAQLESQLASTEAALADLTAQTEARTSDVLAALRDASF